MSCCKVLYIVLIPYKKSIIIISINRKISGSYYTKRISEEKSCD